MKTNLFKGWFLALGLLKVSPRDMTRAAFAGEAIAIDGLPTSTYKV